MATNNSVNVGLAGSTGTGSFVGSTSPTLVTPVLGTPSSGNLANCTGFPVSTANYTLSASSGNYSTASGTPAAVTNLSCAITTTGRPVIVQLVNDGSANSTEVGGALAATLTLTFYRGVTAIGTILIEQNATSGPGGVMTIEVPSANTYTYTIQASVNGGTGSVKYCKLLVYELH